MFIVVCHLSARYDYQSLGRQMVLYVETAWSYVAILNCFRAAEFASQHYSAFDR